MSLFDEFCWCFPFQVLPPWKLTYSLKIDGWFIWNFLLIKISLNNFWGMCIMQASKTRWKWHMNSPYLGGYQTKRRIVNTRLFESPMCFREVAIFPGFLQELYHRYYTRWAPITPLIVVQLGCRGPPRTTNSVFSAATKYCNVEQKVPLDIQTSCEKVLEPPKHLLRMFLGVPRTVLDGFGCLENWIGPYLEVPGS